MRKIKLLFEAVKIKYIYYVLKKKGFPSTDFSFSDIYNVLKKEKKNEKKD